MSDPQKFFFTQARSVTQQMRIYTWNPMWSQARNNQNIVRPTPAVPNTTNGITQSLTAMTTADISSSVKLMCSTERARRRSRSSRNALRGTYVAAQLFPMFYSGYSLATKSLATQSGLLQKHGH